MGNKFTRIINKIEWQNLLDKVLFKTFFHNKDWEEFLEKQFKWLKFERYIYGNSALLSLARVGDKLISHPFCEYGGLTPLVNEIDFCRFREDLFSEFKNPVRINFHPFEARTFLALSGPRSILAQSERVSYFVEGGLDLRKTTRHEIEKAEKNNLQIERCQNKKDLRDFYDVYLKSARKHRIPAYPLSFFDYFLNSKEAEIILARKNRMVIAGSVFLFYDKFMHYFQNAVDEKYRNLGANYLILWRQIQKCLQDKKVFDFGGTRIGSSLQTFKEGWGGKKYPIFELKNYEEARLKKSKLRNIFGLLPPFLIEKLSPHLLKYKL